ncbi:hypothetical protein ADL05_26130 [Nocardiopsis sp. NRRL B-16309]|nr:hypothetical protein ADL05_26130 [Nocardiopsis sp. NRRL B-16309]
MVCSPCVGALAADLRALWPTGDLHGLDTDLDIAIAKLAVFPSGGGGRGSSEPPLPINDTASDVRRHLHSMLSTWCRLLLDEHGGDTPTDTIPSMARYLHSRTSIIRVAEWGEECVVELRGAVRRARAAVDRPAERIYAGPCPTCEGAVYGLAGYDSARCPREGCGGVVVDPEGRRAQAVRAAVEAAPDQRVTAAEAAMASRALGKAIGERAVRKLAAAGKITPVSTVRPVKYRLGDIMDVVDQKAKVA